MWEFSCMLLRYHFKGVQVALQYAWFIDQSILSYHCPFHWWRKVVPYLSMIDTYGILLWYLRYSHGTWDLSYSYIWAYYAGNRIMLPIISHVLYSCVGLIVAVMKSNLTQFFSFWQVQKSLKWVTVLKTELSSMGLRNVSTLVLSFMTSYM